MIDRFCSYILDKMKEYVIFDIGARDCLESIQFYKKFPNAKIYSFECNKFSNYKFILFLIIFKISFFLY